MTSHTFTSASHPGGAMAPTAQEYPKLHRMIEAYRAKTDDQLAELVRAGAWPANRLAARIVLGERTKDTDR